MMARRYKNLEKEQHGSDYGATWREQLKLNLWYHKITMDNNCVCT